MITAAVLALALSGAPDTSRAPPPPPVAALTPAWWPQLDDPVLRDLLTRASQGSLDLKIAVARLERAGADIDLAEQGQCLSQLRLRMTGRAGVTTDCFTSNEHSFQ